MFLFQDDIFSAGGRECLPGTAPTEAAPQLPLPFIGKVKLHREVQGIVAKDHHRHHDRQAARTIPGSAAGTKQSRPQPPSEPVLPELPSIVPAPPPSAPYDAPKTSARRQPPSAPPPVVTSEAKTNATSSSCQNGKPSSPKEKGYAKYLQQYLGGHRIALPPNSARSAERKFHVRDDHLNVVAVPSTSPKTKRLFVRDGVMGKSGLPVPDHGMQQNAFFRRGDVWVDERQKEDEETNRLFEVARERRRQWMETAATGRLKAHKSKESKELDAQPKSSKSQRSRGQTAEEGQGRNGLEESSTPQAYYDDSKSSRISMQNGGDHEPISMAAALIAANGTKDRAVASLIEAKERGRRAKSVLDPTGTDGMAMTRISCRDIPSKSVPPRRTKSFIGGKAPRTTSVGNEPSSVLKRLRSSLKEKTNQKGSLNDRLKRLRRLRKHGMADHDNEKGSNEILSEEDKEFLSEIFTLYDEDESGELDMNELKEALNDLGLQPRSREEKSGLSQVLMEVDKQGDGQIDREEFQDLVVKVMLMIREVQRTELFEQFSMCASEETGACSFDEAFRILEHLALAPRTEAEREVVQAIVREVDEDDSGQIEFDEFEKLTAKSREKLGKMRRKRCRDVCKQEKLDDDTFQQFKDHLLELKDAFDAYDDDKSGQLDRREISMLVADCGLSMRTQYDREQVNELIGACDINRDGSLNFSEFLHLVQSLRGLSRDRRMAELKEVFQQYDKDGSGELSLAEVSSMLCHMDLTPKTRAEQRQIALLLEEVDKDGSGELDFGEFAQLYQSVSEKLATIKRKEEVETAKELNLSLSAVEEYSVAFATLDPRGTGELGMDSVRRMMDLLRINISGDALNELFCEVDKDESGVVEFKEFLELMKSVEKWVQQSKALTANV